MKNQGHIETLTNMGKGRPKGTPNKFTEIKKNILEVFNKLGGTDGMVKWARRNPTAFYRLVASLLPKSIELSGTDGKPLLPPQVIVTVNFIKADGNSPPAAIVKSTVMELPSPGEMATKLIEQEEEEN